MGNGVAKKMNASSPFKVLYVLGYCRAFTGSQRSLSLLIEHLPAQVAPTILLTGPGRAISAFHSVGIRTIVLPTSQRLDAYEGELLRSGRWTRVRYFLDALAYSVRVWILLRRERPAIVHCNDSRALLLVGFAARLQRLPVIWHLRGLNPLERVPFLNRIAQRLASAVVVVADAVAPKTLRSGLLCERIYNGVSPAAASTNSGQSHVDDVIFRAGFDPSRTKRLMIASTLTPYKGHHHLFRALSLLIADGVVPADELVCLVLGAESTEREKRYASYLRWLGDDLGISRNVLWLGWQDDTKPWMLGTDIVVLPTVDTEVLMYPDGNAEAVRCLEGFPRTLLEAMATGRASVATDVAGVREAIEDGVTGIVVPPSEPDALARALERLLRDEKLRSDMGHRALARVDVFSVSRTADETFALYRRLLSR